METIIPASTKRDTQLFLLSLGGSPRRQGFLFLGQCIDIIAEHEELRRCLYKQVYAAVARPYGTTTSGVDSAIRREINSMWKLQRPAFVEVFAPHGERPPSPSEFIFAAAIYLK